MMAFKTLTDSEKKEAARMGITQFVKELRCHIRESDTMQGLMIAYNRGLISWTEVIKKLPGEMEVMHEN